MQIKKQLLRTLLTWGLLLGFILCTQPQKLPVILLVVPFGLLFGGLLELWSLVVPIARRLSGRRGYAGSRRLRITVCGSLVLCLVMQSLGQLTVRDTGTILAIAAIGYVYIGRSRPGVLGR